MEPTSAAAPSTEPGLIRRTQQAVEASKASLIEKTAESGANIASSNLASSNAAPPSPIQGAPRPGGLVHVVA